MCFIGTTKIVLNFKTCGLFWLQNIDFLLFSSEFVDYFFGYKYHICSLNSIIKYRE